MNRHIIDFWEHSVQMGVGTGSSLSTDGMLDPCELGNARKKVHF